MKYTIRTALPILRPNTEWSCETAFYSDLEWVDSSAKPTETEINNKIAELDAEEPMKLLREERNKRLSECDWIASSDLTMSDEWKTYRQALRDMTTQTPSLDYNYELDLTSITWPTKPS
tara:strand:+ start:99 stop:455 length:357 start_codon:yes stop_codon:yes gene_type:complete